MADVWVSSTIILAYDTEMTGAVSGELSPRIPRTLDERGGHLSALFRWQSGKRSQLENFCTEALASAIVSQPGPFLDLLECAEMLPAQVTAAQVEELRVSTQGPTETGKLVDLQLTLRLAGGKRAAVWIEVKVGTGLRTGQLESYAKELERVHGGEPWRLLVLSCTPEGPARDNLRWQQVRAMIPADAHSHWLDLRVFLEEKQVADIYDEGLTVHEFAMVDPARVVLRKVARAMAELSRRLAKAKQGGQSALWPKGFPNKEQKILNLVATTFRRGSGFVIGGYRVGPRLQLGVRATSEGPEAFVMIKTRKSHVQTRKKVWAVLDTIAEPTFGLVDAGPMEARGVSLALAKLSTQDELVGWWFGKLEVLADAGALELCGGSINTAEADEADEADEDGEDES
ncbi:hypothetical protein ENSA5_30920 [Enhygromyxa salina]|uniref:PD-(D/E)XK nuclease superfamily protein n=2 Tax=Enhygromyxa salina TaxID=215803 RepID=A0A2S9XYD6_9BACT|nr:hypothetical protein ENSA5_30920 [Enhygromyxa salina]